MFEIAEKTPRQHFEGTFQPAQAKLKLALQECQVVFTLMTHLNLNESLTNCQTNYLHDEGQSQAAITPSALSSAPISGF
jgi:hypothetical protein